uniref:Uncharacterized protein n=1 Tax=Anguilla anguilla TaxID=7936 RepID=A0A0E9WWI3_ANGAN
MLSCPHATQNEILQSTEKHTRVRITYLGMCTGVSQCFALSNASFAFFSAISMVNINHHKGQLYMLYNEKKHIIQHFREVLARFLTPRYLRPLYY